jgi:hypothetical protein
VLQAAEGLGWRELVVRDRDMSQTFGAVYVPTVDLGQINDCRAVSRNSVKEFWLCELG